jgi:hypothetical protein
LPSEIDELLDHYDHTDPDERAKLKEWAKAVRRRRSVRARHDLPAGVQDFVDNEAQAIRQLIWEPLLVPALCQNEDFAAALIAAMEPRLDGDEIDRRVKARLARQHVLTRPESPQEIQVIIDEGVLTRTVGGPQVMIGLLHHLLDMASWQHVSVQMIPRSAGAHPGLAGWFAVLEFDDPDVPALGFTDGPGGQTPIEDPDKVNLAVLRFGYLSGIALSARDTVAWIRHRIAELERGGREGGEGAG